MAGIGLRSFLYAPLVETAATATTAASHSYGEVKKLNGAIERKVTFVTNEGELYAEDCLYKSNYNVSKVNLSIGVADDKDAVFGPLLGQEKKTVTVGTGENATTVEQYEIGANDDGGYYGFAEVVPQDDGTYEARVYRKVKFKPFITDAKTKPEKLEYTTVSVEGVASHLDDGSKIIAQANCPSMAIAVAYLKQVLSENTAEE